MVTLGLGEAVLRESKHTGSDWTFKCQGAAFDGEHWYLVSNETHRVHKRTRDMTEEVEVIDLGVGDAPHLGAPCWYEGSLYVPIQGPYGVAIATPSCGTWQTRVVPVSLPGLDDYLAACAMNPLDGLLYTSNFGMESDVVEVVGFDLSVPGDPDNEILHRIPLKQASRKVQGLALTRHGHLLLSSDESDDIRFYRALDGDYLGSIPVEKHSYQEIEGVTVAEGVTITDGEGCVETQVHLVLNFWAPPTSIWLKHYGIPGAEGL